MSARPAPSRHARRMQIQRRRRLRRTVTVTVGLLLLGTVVARAGEPSPPTMLAVSDQHRSAPSVSTTAAVPTSSATTATPAASTAPVTAASPSSSTSTMTSGTGGATATQSSAQATTAAAGVTIEPGTYVLWKKSANEVFLVKDGVVQRAMPTTDLDWKTPVGDYRVYLRQRNTIGYDEQGRLVHLEYFVAYHKSPLGGDIGFHQMPYYSDGSLIEPMAELGQPGWSSEGCERLNPADALAVWDFAPIGTVVKVR